MRGSVIGGVGGVEVLGVALILPPIVSNDE